MKKVLSYLVLVLLSVSGPSGVEALPYTNIISPKSVKRSGLGRRIQSGTNDGADRFATSTLTPKIHEGVWPDFCIHHLQSDPEGCSTWEEDKQKNVELDFILNGHSECQIDRDLLNRLGHLIYLFPQRSQGYMRRCDYAWCRKCSQTVIRGLSCDEVEDWDDNGDEVYSYKYFPVYKCGCTGRWWLDIRLLKDEDCDIYEGWKLCKAPSIYHGYPDWHHQSYFRDLKIYLTYLEENPSCNCYWPQVNTEAKEISDLTYEKLFSALNNSSLEDLRNSLINQYLIEIEESLQQPFVHLYTQCLAKHPHPKIYYERGMVHFHQGNNLDALDDIRHFMANAKDKTCLTSDFYLKEGRLLSESLSYDEAIVALTRAIEKDPKNREAYFERAIAYFETGSFDMALVDYLTSGIRPKKIERLYYVTLSQGIALGMLKGSKDSLTEFVPSLLSSCQGISRGLWAFVSHPLALSQDLVDSACACMEYIRDNTAQEVLCKLVPELQECLAKWNQLNA